MPTTTYGERHESTTELGASIAELTSRARDGHPVEEDENDE